MRICIILLFISYSVATALAGMSVDTSGVKKGISDVQNRMESEKQRRKKIAEETYNAKCKESPTSCAPSTVDSEQSADSIRTGTAIVDPKGGTCTMDGDRRLYCDDILIGQASKAPLGGVWDNCSKRSNGKPRLWNSYDEAISSILERCNR